MIFQPWKYVKPKVTHQSGSVNAPDKNTKFCSNLDMYWPCVELAVAVRSENIEFDRDIVPKAWKS